MDLQRRFRYERHRHKAETKWRNVTNATIAVSVVLQLLIRLVCLNIGNE